MNFLYKEYFYWAILIVPMVLVLFFWAKVRRRKMLDSVLGEKVKDSSVLNLSLGRRAVRCGLLLAVMLLLVTAIARPWWGSVTVPFASSGRDILVLFDVSKSMLASDVAPSRLEHAKFMLRELVESNSGDRFGLAAFAGDSFLQSPLTSDKTSFIQYIDELNCDSIPVGGTNIERALKLAESAFNASEGNFRAILLITDGDELTGDSKKIIADLKAKNIPLFIIGLGDPTIPALIPDGKGGYMRDSQGELVKSKLAEAQLQELALATGGIYVRSTGADSGLNAIEKRIDSLIQKNHENGVRSIPVERFPYFLSAAAILLLGYFLLGERRSGVVAIGVLFWGLMVQAEAPKETVLDDVAIYNQALNLQEQQQEGSEELYFEAIKKAISMPTVRSRSFFNLAVGRQEQAEEMVNMANEELQAQQLDSAEKGLKEASAKLDESMEFYRNALSTPDTGENRVDSGKNLQQLFNTQKEVEELLKKIEELKKQQQKAQEETQKAKEQQEQNQDQQQSQQQMQSAQDAAKELEKQAQELNQEQLSQDAKSAQDELKKAEEASKNNQQKESMEHLDNALEKLGANQSSDEQKQDGEDSSKDSQEQQDKQDDQERQEQNQPNDEGNEEQKSAPQPEQGKLDRDSAEQLLEMLAAQEQDLRDALKAKMKNQQIKVEKDW